MKHLWGIIFFLLCCAPLSAEERFFLWSQPDGTPVIIFSDGNIKPIYTIWAGYAAWNEPKKVAQKIREKISQGYVLYIFSYQFGDNGIKNNLSQAISFDQTIAEAIGNHFALVNIETEWDALMDLMKSSEGKQVFRKRIQTFRKYSPKAVLFSSPGLWKPENEYTWFKEFNDLLDFRSDLQHVVSHKSQCTERANGSYFEGGRSLEEGKRTFVKVLENQIKMESIWGKTTQKIFTADLAITSCGWSAQGQASIVREIVKNFPTLYNRGWRGALIRNYAPDNIHERYMGIENEGGFVFSYHKIVADEIAQGLTIAQQMVQKEPKDPTEPLPNFSVTLDPSSHEWWLQIKINPNELVKKITLLYKGSWVPLTKQSWGDWTLSNYYLEKDKLFTLRIESIDGKFSDKKIKW